MGTVFQDLRYGLRMLAKNPGFTAVAVITLALGIGANTAIFSLIDAVLLKRLPVKNPEQLVLLNWVSREWPGAGKGYSSWGPCPIKTELSSGCSFSFPTFEQIRSKSGDVLSGVFAFAGPTEVNVNFDGQASLAGGEFVTGDAFPTLGVNAALGRTITKGDDRPGAEPVAVVSYTYWNGRLGHNPSVIGKVISLNGVPFTIVGVTPAKFLGLQQAWSWDMYLPLSTKKRIEPDSEETFDAEYWWLWVIGRLKPGVSQKQAEAALEVIFRQNLAAAQKPPFKPGDNPRIELASASKGLYLLRFMFSKPLFILMAVVGVVLLIACANVANLLLARAAVRRKEIAVRLAVGAGRRRLVRQLLTESLLLGSAGGAVGIFLAIWGSSLLATFASTGWLGPINLEVHPDLTVLGFTAAISILTGILFGLAPAFRGTQVELTTALKASSGSRLGTSRQPGGLRLGLGNMLVVSQVALALLLLIGAGLFLRTLVNLKALDAGFNPQNILLFGLQPALSGYKGQRLENLCQELQARLSALPGVVSASFSRNALVSGNMESGDISIEGDPQLSSKPVDILRVGSTFFETIGMRVVLGRTIGPQDVEPSRKVAVINETMAHRFFPNQNPLGRRLGWSGNKAFDIEIIGVARDAKYDELRREIQPTIYLGYTGGGSVYFELRTAADPAALIPAVRTVLQRVDRNLPLFDVKTQIEQIDQSLFSERLIARLSSLFGFLALILATVGLYGVMSYAVAQRTNEIGIRMALGAEPRDMLKFVIRQGMVLTLTGLAIGLCGALALTRLLSSMLFGVPATDPLTFAAVTFLLALVALLACYLPARRATKVDPMVALHYE